MKFTFCKKQYIYLALAIVSACLALTAHVFAQEPNTTNSGDGNAPAMNTRGMGMRRELSEKTHNRIVNLGENLHIVTRAAIDRMTNIAGRIDSRIAKLKSSGVSTTAAEAELALARASLKAAEEDLEATMQTLATTPGTNDPLASFTIARTQYVSAHRAITETRTHLLTAIVTLKGAATGGTSSQIGTGNSASTSIETPRVSN